MKKLFKRTIVVFLGLFPCLLVQAMASLDDPNDIPLKPLIPGQPNPRTVDMECYYQNGYVYVIGDSGVTSISGTVTRLSDNMQWSDNCTGNILQIAVSTDPGTYMLIFTLSDGSSYYGNYTL